MKQKSGYVRGKFLGLIASIIITKCIEAKRLIDEYPEFQPKEDESLQS